MAKQKSEGVHVVCTNKKARRDYHIEDTFEAGLVLRGSEVKSLREGLANLTDAYAFVEKGEAWISGLHVSPYSHAPMEGQDPDRARKLLLHALEIRRLAGKIQEKGYTLVPLRIYFRKGLAKVELGLGKGKKLYDKREDIKRADADREIARALRRG
ncbi:MAG: SsrA-binding protein SmpB [Deltaproteobacteria bacterium]|nr:SsrA-binding protein SmpB [Deltaproteobacteria bacterium]